MVCYIGFVINILIEGLAENWEYLTSDPLFQTNIHPFVHRYNRTQFSRLGFNIDCPAVGDDSYGGHVREALRAERKLTGFVVLSQIRQNEFYKMMHPSTVTTVTINGKGTSGSVVQKLWHSFFFT